MIVSSGQVAEFAERGYVVVRGAVASDTVAAVNAFVDRLLVGEPLASDVRGPANRFPRTEELAELEDLVATSVLPAAEALTGPGTLELPWQTQIALNVPPNPHHPGWHHLDGVGPHVGERPGTFTLLAGLLLTDQTAPDNGNLWVWPGSHLAHARYFREHGPGRLVADGGYPQIAPSEPEQVLGEAGDLLLAHYLLGHNIGGNTGPNVRRAAYWRVKRHGHDDRWPHVMQDPWVEYDPVREVPGA
ncbi:phytanoyl-CoA dioxygenase family protein [Yinghuangia seranimata]|uniref:phytanoyl-CoA dioxygenase family protein n=1 Tax=Yinghuangia seranimata TaxID=408067 RepID=UPI00248C628D|nr:phytanoyl-CoA dioxygenase family protein [Yinghuangia seranimata]MDI2124550.1 phytanoyl-CoA dioxygenase family protein [Yinghuangia seranimata]